jgi:hypothetical protein
MWGRYWQIVSEERCSIGSGFRNCFLLFIERVSRSFDPDEGKKRKRTIKITHFSR